MCYIAPLVVCRGEGRGRSATLPHLTHLKLALGDNDGHAAVCVTTWHLATSNTVHGSDNARRWGSGPGPPRLIS